MQLKLIFSRAFALLMAFMLMITGLIPSVTPEAKAATKVSYKVDQKEDYTRFTVTSGDLKGAKGYCGDAFHAPPGNGTATIQQLPQNHVITRVMYYQLVLQGWKDKNGHTKAPGWSVGEGNGDYGSIMHYLIAYTRTKAKFHNPVYKKYSNNPTTLAQFKTVLIRHQGWKDTKKSYKKLESTYNAAVKAVPAAPDNFNVYYLNPGNPNKQDSFVWKFADNGRLTLIKSSTNPQMSTLTGYSSFAGISYDIYKADKTSKVGILNCFANGTSNVISLPPGTYYARESATNNYYKLDASWKAIAVKSNALSTLTVADTPDTGNAQVIKKELNGNFLPLGDTFTFKLVNTQNSAYTYTITVKGNGSSPTASGSVAVPAGTYTVTETSMPDNYINVTGRGTVVVPPKGTGTITWINELPQHNTVKVYKETDDGGRLDGFKFKVTGKLFNQGKITSEMVLDAAKPDATLGDSADDYELGKWSVDEKDLEALNKAAADRETGSYTVKVSTTATGKSVQPKTDYESLEKLIEDNPSYYDIATGKTFEDSDADKTDWYYEVVKSGTDQASLEAFEASDATYSGKEVQKDDENTVIGWFAYKKVDNPKAEDIEISIPVKIELKPVEYDAEEDTFVSKIGEKTSKSDTIQGASVTYNDFEWIGAATIYKDVNTGEDFTILTTDEFGAGYVEGAKRAGIERGAYCGEFTVEEMMTDNQKARYKEPKVQTKTISDEEIALFNFNFENNAYWTDIRLKKTSTDDKIQGIRFSLKGTTNFGDTVDKLGITDENGFIDFGKVHAGKYIVEEVDFDAENYLNTQKLTGYDHPAMALTVTGTETDPIELAFQNVRIQPLYLTKVDGEDYNFLENANFELYEGSELAAKFQIVLNDDNTAGINMIWSNGKIEGTMSKTIIPETGDNEDEDEGLIDDSVEPEEEVIVADDEGSSSGTTTEDATADVPSDDSGHTAVDPSTIDLDTLKWARLTGLEVGKHYTLKETKAPKGGYVVASPIDIDFTGTTRVVVENFIPRIETVASDSETKDNISYADGKAVITDKVSYTHLTPGQQYTMQGTFYYRPNSLDEGDYAEAKQGADPLEVSGKQVSGKQVFTASETGNGTVDIPFDFDANELAGKTVVIYESLYATPDGGDTTFVASHKDASALTQTVWFPKVETIAADITTGDNVGQVSKTAVFKDTVKYSNVLPEKEYTIKGKLVDKETGNTVATAEPVTFKAPAAKADVSSVEGTETISFNIDTTALDGHTLVAFEELYYQGVKVGSHEEINDEGQSVHYPSVSTTAVDSKTGDHVGSIFGRLINQIRGLFDDSTDEVSTVIDTVSCKNLVPGESYTVKGVLMNKEDNTQILDANGQPITASEDFEAKEANEILKLKFPVDTSELNNKTVVVFEKLYHKTKETGTVTEVARHENIKDEEQSVHEVEIKTHAVDKHVADKDHDWHTGNSTGKTTIVDTVAMKNLVAGMTYTVKGTLQDKATGEPVTDPSGKPYTAEKTFTVPNADGDKRVDMDVEMEFEVDGEALASRTVVAFEKLYHNDVMISLHADINDEDQSVYYPEIKTVAVDGKTGTKETQISEDTNIKDTVSFKNLLPGNYVLEGKLMDKQTGKPMLDAKGNEVTQSKEFTITTKEEGLEGTQEINFNFDTSNLADHTAVVFEKLYRYEGDYKVDIAKHENIKDKEQSVWIIDIGTHLKDVASGINEGEERTDAQFIDTVDYHGLIVGKKYTMKGILMDKETKEPFKDADGKTVESTAEFTPKESSGTVELTFKANTTGLAGKTVVAFEELYPEDHPDTVIAEHKDIKDEKQSVSIVKIRTNAIDAKSGVNESFAGKDATVTDRVTYTGLTVGRSYTLKARMMDKETGKPVVIDGKELTAETVFTPTKSDDFADVVFKFDASSVAGKSIVAFETLYQTELKENPVAHHEDINDEAQTVHVPSVLTVAELDGKEVIDEVTYFNLIPGKYIARGWLVDQDNEKVLSGSEGEASFELTEITPEGSVEVVLPIKNFDKLHGHSITAFEEIYLVTTDENGNQKEVLVAEHKDLEDSDQTVDLPSVKPKTGDNMNLYIFGGLFIAAAIAAVLIFRKKKN